MKISIIIITPGPVLTIKEDYCKLMSREFNVKHMSTYYLDSKLNGKEIDAYKTFYSPYLPKLNIISKLWFMVYCVLHCIIWRLKHEKIDIISAYDPLKTGLVAAICAKIVKAKCITEVNGVYNKAIKLERKTSFINTIKSISVPYVQNFVLKKSAGVKFLFPEQIKELKISTEKKIVKVFPNYVNINKFLECTDHDEKKQVLFAGFPFWIKGVDILISAFKKVSIKYSDWELKILGYYPKRSLLDTYIGKAENITVHNAVMPSEMPYHMQQCAIFVLPSRTEALGRVLVESMAAGKPRIGSDVDGIPVMIRHGIDGLLFKSEDIEDLALKLGTLMGDKILRKKMGAAGRKRARLEFSEDSYLENLRQFYDQVLKR